RVTGLDHVAAPLAEEAGEEAESAAQDGLIVQLIGETESRQERVFRRLVKTASRIFAGEEQSASDVEVIRIDPLHGIGGQSGPGDRLDRLHVIEIEPRNALVVSLDERRLHFITQAEVQRQTAIDAPIVLDEEAPRLRVLGI